MTEHKETKPLDSTSKDINGADVVIQAIQGFSTIAQRIEQAVLSIEIAKKQAIATIAAKKLELLSRQALSEGNEPTVGDKAATPEELADMKPGE